MISGFVSSDEARVLLIVRGSNQLELNVEAVIDTGFTGYLTLPSSLIRSLLLPFQGTAVVVLADGSSSSLALYRGTILWDGQVRTVRVLEADGDALIGMSLLRNHKLTLEVVDGGRVMIEALP